MGFGGLGLGFRVWGFTSRSSGLLGWDEHYSWGETLYPKRPTDLGPLDPVGLCWSRKPLCCYKLPHSKAVALMMRYKDIFCSVRETKSRTSCAQREPWAIKKPRVHGDSGD